MHSEDDVTSLCSAVRPPELGEALHEGGRVATVGFEGEIVVDPSPLPSAGTSVDNLNFVVGNLAILD